MNWVSELMVKFDILGLRTLSVIYDTCEQLGIDPNSIDANDKSVYQPLQTLDHRMDYFKLRQTPTSAFAKRLSHQT